MRPGSPRRTTLRAGAVLAAAALAAGLAAGCPGPARDSLEERSADLDFLVRELPRRHKNLYFKITAAEWRARVERFKASLPDLNEDEFRVGMSRLVAAAGDAHTSLRPPMAHAFPVMLFWFKEGIFLTNALPEHADVVYQKLAAVDGHPVAVVIEAFTEIISHENDAQVRYVLPQVLASAEALHGLRLIGNPEQAVFTFLDETGRSTDLTLAPLPLAAAPVWAIAAGKPSEGPLYMRDRRTPYWFAPLPEAKAVYLKYNSCREIEARPFASFVKDVFAAVEERQAERLILDLRDNGGGDSSVFAPFFKELAKSTRVNRKGGLFVILGRRTFSSAVLNAVDLRKRAPAVFVGEPTGGKPNHFGEVKTLRLPRMKLEVSYSTKYFQAAYEDPPSLMPDVLIEMSIADFRARRDPVLEAILSGGIQ
jgi:hypothetical protein